MRAGIDDRYFAWLPIGDIDEYLRPALGIEDLFGLAVIQDALGAGLTPKRNIIRGGTDGSRLSFMGLPCPNIFTGEMAIHSKLEYVSVQDMEKAIDTLVELVQIWEKHEWNQA